ncbi:MAG: phosphoribosylamine--glycine ligase [Acetobacteraceae bacterium]|nr:phosphoribosylamine--glycine ligase [Acetobacteraceae bacterium]
MRVLVIGSGGREHALCWKLAASPLLTKLWCAPGNPGTAAHAENVPIGALDIAALVAFATAHQVDLVVPGPEAPLVAGIADAMEAAGIACCGPSAAAARLEGSKSFTHEICEAAGIPAALWERFDDAEAAREFVRRRGAPIVVKADGLAAGKGVVVAASEAEAEAAIADFMETGSLGEAGRTVVIEECLLGEEVSVFALCDGTTAIPLGSAQDHKRAGDGDTGPNTGGMGAYSPPSALSPGLEAAVMERIIRPALAEMARRGSPFRGILFAGLMLTEDGPKLIEFNVRFGDPECQVILPRLIDDLLPALQAAVDGELANISLRFRPDAALAVVVAARGYPGAYRRHTPIGGVAAASAVPGAVVFHAGTDMRDGQLVSSGGRVLSVVGTAAGLQAAHDAAYAAVDKLNWPDGFCRRDIGWRGLGKGSHAAQV